MCVCGAVSGWSTTSPLRPPSTPHHQHTHNRREGVLPHFCRTQQTLLGRRGLLLFSSACQNISLMYVVSDGCCHGEASFIILIIPTVGDAQRSQAGRWHNDITIAKEQDNVNTARMLMINVHRKVHQRKQEKKNKKQIIEIQLSTRTHITSDDADHTLNGYANVCGGLLSLLTLRNELHGDEGHVHGNAIGQALLVQTELA